MIYSALIIINYNSIWCFLLLGCCEHFSDIPILETVVHADCIFLLSGTWGVATVGANVITRLNRFPTTLSFVGSV